MKAETTLLVKRISSVDTDAFSDVLVDTVFGDPDQIFSGFEGYEAAKGIKNLVENCTQENEFNLINDTCIAILGWSLETLVADAEKV